MILCNNRASPLRNLQGSAPFHVSKPPGRAGVAPGSSGPLFSSEDVRPSTTTDGHLCTPLCWPWGQDVPASAKRPAPLCPSHTRNVKEADMFRTQRETLELEPAHPWQPSPDHSHNARSRMDLFSHSNFSRANKGWKWNPVS